MDQITQVLDFQSPAVIAMGSFVLTKALEYVKQSKYVPWISEHTTGINRLIVILYSIATSLGISAVWTTEYSSESGGALTLHLPGVAEAVNGAWAWWTAELNYKQFVQRPAEKARMEAQSGAVPLG